MKSPILTSIFLLAASLLFSSCGAHSPRVLKEDYQTIHISVFKNRTLQYGIEERLTPAMRNAFLRDGRLRVSNPGEADLEMDGTITEVLVTPMAYSDLERAVGYNMHITIQVTVTDTNTDEVIMKDRPFQAAGTFMLYNEPTFEGTQDVAVALAEDVLSNLIEGW